MMSPPLSDRQAVKKFEPLLFFNKEEDNLNYFPSNIEKYLEFARNCSPGGACAEGTSMMALTQDYFNKLIDAVKNGKPIPDETAAEWKLLLDRGQLTLNSMDPDNYIAKPQSGTYPYIQWNNFLNFGGYSTTDKNFPNPTYATQKYKDLGDLGNSKYYYYAEIADLNSVFPRNFAAYKNFPQLADKPYKVLTYYFFYPMQKSDLVAINDNISTHEADWCGVSILLRKESNGSLTPTMIGNVTSEGLPPGSSIISILGDYLGITEKIPRFARMNLDVRDWADPSVLKDGVHPKIFVSLGNHNNYYSSGEKIRDGADELEQWVSQAFDNSGVGKQIDDAKDALDTITVVSAIACILGGIFSFGLAAAACAAAILSGLANSGIPDSDEVKKEIMKQLATKDHPPETEADAIVIGPSSRAASYPVFRSWKDNDRPMFDFQDPLTMWWLYMGNWGVRLTKASGKAPKALDGALKPDISALFVGHPKVLERLATS